MNIKYTRAINILSDKLKEIPEIDAVLLAGSLAANNSDTYSDLDLYLYLKSELSVEKRHQFILEISSYSEVNNQFWETEDCLILKDSGIKVELIFRSYSWMENELKRVLEEFQASVGYSTCICRNFLESQILVDHSGLFSPLQERFTHDYPVELQKNIIDKNFPLLKDILSSYYNQIELAVKRNDLISINHRVSAYLESYFDILFALNQIYHPGEKKLLKIAKTECSCIPENFESDLNDLLRLDSARILETLSSLTSHLKQML